MSLKLIRENSSCQNPYVLIGEDVSTEYET